MPSRVATPEGRDCRRYPYPTTLRPLNLLDHKYSDCKYSKFFNHLSCLNVLLYVRLPYIQHRDSDVRHRGGGRYLSGDSADNLTPLRAPIR